MLRKATIYDDTPAALRRLLVTAYGLSVPTFTALLAIEAIPGRRDLGVLAMLATAAAGLLWLLARRRPGTIDWILVGVVVPTICAGTGFAATGDEVPAILVLGALIPWSAVLFDRRVVVAMWGLATAACFGMSALAGGAALGASHAAAFAVLGGAMGWIVHGKTRSFREAHLRVLESHLNDVEFIVAPGGAIVAANDRAEEAFGYSRRELESMNVAALVPPELRARLRAGLAEAARGGVVAKLDHVRKDGTRFPVEVSSRPFTSGGVAYVHGLLRDLTAQRAAEAALIESQRRLSTALDEVREEVTRREKLLSVVAHDLRSPLAAIALTAAGLEDLAESDRARVELTERAEIVRQAARRMQWLVDDLVDVAAIERGSLRLTLADRDPREILDAALQQLRPVAVHREIDLVLAAPEPRAAVPPIRCDEGRILQVLTNIVSNALAFTPPGGAVDVALAARPEGVQFTVRDTGPGLSREIAEHLFEPYQRGPGSQQKGAGLGLAIAKGIVDAHGGRIWADSSPGGGATFHFLLPGAAREEAVCPG